MDWIVEGIALGGLEDALDHRLLETAGIRSVLSLTDFPTLDGSRFTWSRIALLDGPGNALQSIEDAVAQLEQFHRVSPSVLVHCAEGKSRSAFVVALYLTRLYGCGFAHAYSLVRAARPRVDIDAALQQIGNELKGRHDALRRPPDSNSHDPTPFIR